MNIPIDVKLQFAFSVHLSLAKSTRIKRKAAFTAFGTYHDVCVALPAAGHTDCELPALNAGDVGTLQGGLDDFRAQHFARCVWTVHFESSAAQRSPERCRLLTRAGQSDSDESRNPGPSPDRSPLALLVHRFLSLPMRPRPLDSLGSAREGRSRSCAPSPGLSHPPKHHKPCLVSASPHCWLQCSGLPERHELHALGAPIYLLRTGMYLWAMRRAKIWSLLIPLLLWLFGCIVANGPPPFAGMGPPAPPPQGPPPFGEGGPPPSAPQGSQQSGPPPRDLLQHGLATCQSVQSLQSIPVRCEAQIVGEIPTLFLLFATEVTRDQWIGVLSQKIRSPFCNYANGGGIVAAVAILLTDKRLIDTYSCATAQTTGWTPLDASAHSRSALGKSGVNRRRMPFS